MKQFILRHRAGQLSLWSMILITLALSACRNASPQPTPIATPIEVAATEAPDATAAPNATDGAAATTAPSLNETPPGATTQPVDAWATVRDRGRLIVGTSADYPPFAFYNEAFELDGYDIALARLLAERLGVDVEFKDMAFDGLGGALQVGQIDAALAAISITDARREVLDFSTLYFISEGAALARAGADITINRVEDMAGYRVAVQSGSIYQTWIEDEAVETGLMPADNLLAYTNAGKAIEDLRAGLVDVVIADRLPLELAASDQTLAIVGEGLNRQRIAVALANGSTLLGPINEALFELQREGDLARLAEEFLQLDQTALQPLPGPDETTEEATASGLTTNACIDAMTLIAHLSFDDDGMRSPPPVSPGTPFQKTWRIQNNGTCTWTTGYVLTPVGGNVPQATMGGMPTPIQAPVAPGETTDVTVDLVAPLLPGVYQGFWSMRSPNGLLFGDRLWVGITVPAQPTPTPPPTATVSPSIEFTADRTNIRAGECVVFRWNVANGGDVFFYAQGQSPALNRVAATGSQTECPPVTMLYELRVEIPGGATEIRNIRIDVQPSPDAPFFEFFSVTPNQQIAVGQCVDVRWRVSGDVTNIRVSRNDTTLWDGAPLNGTSRDCPPVGEAVYSIEVVGPGGTSRALENLSVLPATPAPGVPTATPAAGQLPVINSLIVSPNRIFVGNCLTVSWNVSGNVSRVQLRRDGVLVLDFALFSGSVTDCLNTEGTYVYRLDAANAQGGSVFQQASATVTR